MKIDAANYDFGTNQDLAVMMIRNVTSAGEG